MELLDASRGSGAAAKTLISSDCPGWICYAEKTHPEVLPWISHVKSPQQICGILVKRLLSARMHVPASSIYHVTVMMCFDKKLEATRSDFISDGVRDVDTVLTSMELLDLMARQKIDFAALPQGAFVTQPFFNQTQPLPVDASNGTQAANMLRHVARARYGIQDPDIVWSVGRNPDIREASLVVDGQTRFKVCVANGFRNLQNIVRRLKSPKGMDADYVEIMACPSGCLNGGGQIRAAPGAPSKELLARVTSLYKQQQQQSPAQEGRDALLRWVYDEVVGGPPGSEKARAWFHTQYHAVPPMNDNALFIKW